MEKNEYRRIEAILEERRANARRAFDVRRKEAYDAVPELEQIEYEIAEAGIRHNRALLSGAASLSETRAGLDREIGALKTTRDEILDKNGFSGGYFAPTPVCPVCGDTGIVAGANGQPARCECFKQLLFDGLESSSNILSAGYAGFDKFDETLFSDKADAAKFKHPDSPRKNITKIKESALKFISDFNGGVFGNLYFFGEAGSGKTFMAASIACELMRGGTAVLYLSAPSLFNIITEHRMRSVRDEEYRDTLYRQIFSCKLLIIDDLGTESLTDSRYTEFFALINERLVPGACSTIISTNNDLKGLQALYDERVVSRIVKSFTIIRFFGEDLRWTRRGNP